VTIKDGAITYYEQGLEAKRNLLLSANTLFLFILIFYCNFLPSNSFVLKNLGVEGHDPYRSPSSVSGDSEMND
jgi:hypothetical protein